MLFALASLGVPLPARGPLDATMLVPASGNLTDLSKETLAYWNKMQHRSKPVLPKSAVALFDPSSYPGTACESWCSGDVQINRGDALARGRINFPTDDVRAAPAHAPMPPSPMPFTCVPGKTPPAGGAWQIAPWVEKCSWDKYCAGCSECDGEVTCGTMLHTVPPPWRTVPL